MPTPGYWIECSRQKISLPTPHTIWDESDSEHEDIRAGSANDAYLERECSDLYEDDEDSEATPRYIRNLQHSIHNKIEIMKFIYTSFSYSSNDTIPYHTLLFHYIPCPTHKTHVNC